MTASQRLMIRQSEIRERVRVLLEKGELDAAETTEKKTLLNEQRELEPKLREALETEGVETTIEGEDQEAREKRELRGRASVTRFVLAAVSGRVPDGAEAEYGSALRAGVGKIPIDIFEADRPREIRADAVTPAPAVGSGVVVAPIQPFVFSQSIAPRLGHRDAFGGLRDRYSSMTITTSESCRGGGKGRGARIDGGSS